MKLKGISKNNETKLQTFWYNVDRHYTGADLPSDEGGDYEYP